LSEARSSSNGHELASPQRKQMSVAGTLLPRQLW
jgi:hypothetical protein